MTRSNDSHRDDEDETGEHDPSTHRAPSQSRRQAPTFREAGGEMHPTRSVESNGASPKSKKPENESDSDDDHDDKSADGDNEKEGNAKSEKNKKDNDGAEDTKKKPSPEEKRKAARKKIIIFSALGALVVITLIIGIPWLMHARHFETTDDAFIDAHPQRVAPQVAGRVLKVSVNDNELVQADQILLEIDPADYQVRVTTEEANVAEQRGKVAQANAQKSVAIAGVEQSKADLQQAIVNRQNADVELKRNEALSAEAISRQRLDDLRASAATLAAQQTAAEKKLDSAKAQVELADSQIAAAASTLQSAEAQLSQAKLNLSYTTVRATVAGRITKKDVQVGDYISMAQVVMSIVPNEMWVTANYKETQLTDMRPGQPVDIEVDAFPDEVFYGKVQSVQAGTGAAFSLLPAENATGNYVKVVQRVPVKIAFDDTGSDAYKRLSPGMSVVPKARVR